jgi:Fur family ferric uptake transcriptional regulator
VGERQRHPTSDWAEHALRELARAGYRRGGARRAILELLGEHACALSVIDIRRALSESGREVSRASLYRVIEELEGLGLLTRVDVGGSAAMYEAARHGPGHHHHLVCERCGRLEPFTDEGLERAIRRLSERLPLRVHEHEIVIRGSCSECEGAEAGPPISRRRASPASVRRAPADRP